MDTNEIMVPEMTEEITQTGSLNGVKIAVGVGAAVVIGVLAYKYVVKPTIAKVKAARDRRMMDEGFDYLDEESKDTK